MHDLYRRARKAGLSKQAAHALAYTPSIDASPSAEQISWDTLLALQCTYEEEVVANIREFSLFPFNFLLQASDTKDFRARARRAWRKMLLFYKSEQRSPGSRSSSERTKEIFRTLLSQPDVPSFVSAWSKETELQHRVLRADVETYQKINEKADEDSGALRLKTAALTLRRKEQAPSASALADALEMSRPALYRAFGSDIIQKALNLVHNDPQAIQEGRNDKRAKGQKQRWFATEQDK